MSGVLLDDGTELKIVTGIAVKSVPLRDALE